MVADGNNRVARIGARPYCSRMKSFLAVIFCLVALCPLVQAQGLAGTEGLTQCPRSALSAGKSAGGPLLPGKSDAERWRLVQSNLQSLIGKDKAEVKRLFGKEGGKGLEKDEVVYQVTAALPRKPGGLHCMRFSQMLCFDID